MVEKKYKRTLYFLLFILPCLVLYALFCIVPFVRGIGISLRQWDGLTPRTPLSLNRAEFESQILDTLTAERDRDYVLSIYRYDAADDSYKRFSVGGTARIKLERIIKKTKYEPEFNKFVGLDNYKKIFTGRAHADFYPHVSQIAQYERTSQLKRSIGAAQFKNEVLKGAAQNEAWRAVLTAAYLYNEQSDTYVLADRYSERHADDALWNLIESGENAHAAALTATILDEYMRAVKERSVTAPSGAAAAYTEEFVAAQGLDAASATVFYRYAETIDEIATVKNALADAWVVQSFNMGVIGFTLFFAVFSVIGINVLAFALALALDTGIRAQKAFRTVFFLPNVLSMIIVAHIWSMLFNQLHPAVTGIDRWISDAHKTPWLLVLVAVWQGAGYYMIVYLAGLQNIPTQVIEASKIDGVTAGQRFRHITMPLMIPSLTISFFLMIANALKSFDLIFALLGPTGYATGTVPFVMDIYFDAFSKKQAGLATAKAMVLFLVIVLITGVQLYVMKRKEVET